MPLKKSLETSMNFYEALGREYQLLYNFTEKHELSIHEFKLLLIIYKNKSIQLRSIIQSEMMKTNQINKSVKNLYDKKLIHKERVPLDERTVELSIREDQMDYVSKLIKSFATVVEKFQDEDSQQEDSQKEDNQ